MAVNIEKFTSAGIHTIHAGVLRSPSGRFDDVGNDHRDLAIDPNHSWIVLSPTTD